MPEKRTVRKAQRAKRQGKAPSTQAGAFVEEEIHHVREGKHGAKSTKQAIAIGLSKARSSGVNIPDKTGKKKKTSKRISAKKTSSKRSAAGKRRLKQASKKTASHNVLSLQAHRAAMKRTAKQRSDSAKKAARTREHNKAA